MALSKQIIRVHGDYADLVAGAGASELQLYMIGIASDTDEFIFRSDDGFHRCLDSGTTVLSENSIPFINASGKATHDNANLQFNDGTDTLTAKNILIGDSCYIGSASDTDAIQIEADGDVVFSQSITIADGGNITLQEDISFVGATTENKIKFPDNLAVALSFGEGANLYQTFVSTDAGEKIVFGKIFNAVTASTIGNLTLANGSITDSGGAISFDNETLTTTGSITGNSFITASNIGIAADTDLIQLTGANAMLVNGTLQTGHVGINIAPGAPYFLRIYDNAINTGSPLYGINSDLTKTLGFTNTSDHYYGIYSLNYLNQATGGFGTGGVGQIGNLFGIYGEARLGIGEVGSAAVPRNIHALQFTLNLDNGIVWGDAYGDRVRVDKEGSNEVKGSLYARHTYCDALGPTGGTVYMHYFEEGGNIDYCIFQNGTAPSRLVGAIQIASDTNGLVLGATQAMSAIYNGTAGVINTSLIAPSDLDITCGANKTIELQNTVTEDLQFTIHTGKVPAANYPTREAFSTNTGAYAFSVDDYIDCESNEIPHFWKEATTGHLHLHFSNKTIQNTGADRFVKFTIWLTMSDMDEVFAETSYTAEFTIPTATAALTHLYLDMGDIDFSTYKIGAQIVPRVKRIAATGGTEYADDVYIHQVGIHLEKDTMGSRNELTK